MNTITRITVLAGMLLAAGCADVTVRRPEPAPAVYQSAPPVDSGQSMASLARENSQLRASLGRLEQGRRGAEAAVNSLESQKSAMKRTREQVEKDRDYYKKRAKDR
ncbi:MAG: hypothetical protein LLG01_20020 [Planctomycetaceae bacterium]|nr:hypothetical protein [Planctomycetaceae bacterium]